MESKDMFHYVITGNLNIKYSGFKDTSELDITVFKQTDSLIHSRTIYPDGLIFESKVEPGRIELWTSRRLILSEVGDVIFED